MFITLRFGKYTVSLRKHSLYYETNSSRYRLNIFNIYVSNLSNHDID